MLRIVLMYMVCILHMLGQGGLLSEKFFGGNERKIYWIIEIFALCAVDGFAFISGYMAPNRQTVNYQKIIDMWFQAFFYSFIITLILLAFGLNKTLTVKDIIFSAFPLLSHQFWYFSAYFLLFLLTPLLNKILFDLDETKSKKAFFAIVIILSIIGFWKDTFGLNHGYSAMWIIALYCIGVLAKKIHLFENLKSYVLILIWIASIAITWVLKIFLDLKIIDSYLFPGVLLNAIIMVVLFSRIKVKGKIIAKISPLVFGAYLFQLNPIIWNDVIREMFFSVTDESIPLIVFYVFINAFVLLIFGILVEYVRRAIVEVTKFYKLYPKIINLGEKVCKKFKI